MSGFDPDAHCDAMADAMSLTIKPEWRDAIIANLRVTAAMAELVLEFPIEDHAEPAPVFEA